MTFYFPLREGYSAKIRAWLEVAGGRRWNVAAIAENHFVPRVDIDLPPCEAMLVVEIDGEQSRSCVWLVNGGSKAFRECRTQDSDFPMV